MNSNWLSNGLGGQSQFLMLLAKRELIPARVSITADTESENDRVCSTGKRMTSQQFFYEHVKPYGDRHGIHCILAKSTLETGEFVMSIDEMLKRSSERGKAGATFDEMISGLCVPLFTNDRTKGRLRQSCTDKKKIRAIHQTARKHGIKLLRSAIGFHAGEAHRIKARYLFEDGQFSIFKPQVKRDGVMHDVKWLEHYFPCVDLKLNREAIRQELAKEGLPYLVTTECDHCPHQDLSRWRMHTPEVIEKACELERGWQGKLFFTSLRIPLKQALEVMEKKQAANESPDFGCENGSYCGL